MHNPINRQRHSAWTRGSQIECPPTRPVGNNTQGLGPTNRDRNPLPGDRPSRCNPGASIAVYDVKTSAGVQSLRRGSRADKGDRTSRIPGHQQARSSRDCVFASLNLDDIKCIGPRWGNEQVETTVFTRADREGGPDVAPDHDAAPRRGQPAHPKTGRIPRGSVNDRGFDPSLGLKTGNRAVLDSLFAARRGQKKRREHRQNDRSCHSDFHHVRHALEIARHARPVFHALYRGFMSTLPVSIAPFDGRSICLFCGSSDAADPVYTEAARAFGEATANAGWRLVYGGGGVGLMGASARAAHAAGGRVVGIMPAFLRSRERLFDEVETIVVTSMHERKQLMYDQSDAFVVAPGGVGTLEEVVELLSWKRLDLHAKPVIFLNIGGFWETFFALMRHSVETGFTPPSFLDAWVVCDTVEDAIATLRTTEATPGLKHDQR